MENNAENTFNRLLNVEISAKTKEKNGQKYIPWSNAWTMIKKEFPDAHYEIVKDDNGCVYHTDGRTCWVETTLTIDGETQNEILPVLNFKNQAIPAETVTLADVNKSIKRCLTKNAALFGLGLSLWVGEDESDVVKIKRERKQAEVQEASEELLKAQEEIILVAKAQIANGVDKNKLYDIIEQKGGVRQPKRIASLEVCQAIVQALKEAK